MTEERQQTKVATDYGMSRHFNGIVFAIIACMIVLGIVLITLFVRGRRKVLPAVPKTSSSAVLLPPSREPNLEVGPPRTEFGLSRALSVARR